MTEKVIPSFRVLLRCWINRLEAGDNKLAAPPNACFTVCHVAGKCNTDTDLFTYSWYNLHMLIFGILMYI